VTAPASKVAPEQAAVPVAIRVANRTAFLSPASGGNVPMAADAPSSVAPVKSSRPAAKDSHKASSSSKALSPRERGKPTAESAKLLTASASAADAPAAIDQCNGFDNVGGQAVACDVTIVNNLNQATGVASSKVQVRECHGAANAALPCTTSTTPYSHLTTHVTQCDGSGNGGGGTFT
jgi:hypothetical protein